MSKLCAFTPYEPTHGGIASLTTGIALGRNPLTGEFMSGQEPDMNEMDTCEIDLTNFPDWCHQFFGVGADPSLEFVDKDDDDDDDFIDTWNLSADEEAELAELNLRHGTDYKAEDLTVLRRLDGLSWAQKTYGDKAYKNTKQTAVPQPHLHHVEEPRHSNSSGFGAGQKHKVVYHWDFDFYPGRRGHDDARKQRKAAINRFRRSERQLRTVDTARQHEAKAHMADFRGEMEFDKRADGARYYAGLMSHVSPELRADWADYDPWNWEDLHFYEDMDKILDKEFNEYERGYYLRSPSHPSSQGWWFMDLPIHLRLDFQEREWEEYLEQEHQDYMNHMFSERYGYDDYAGSCQLDMSDDDYDDDWGIPTVEEIEDMIAHQEAEEERLLETLPISHSGGLRGLRATKGVGRNLCRPHHFLDAA